MNLSQINPDLKPYNFGDASSLVIEQEPKQSATINQRLGHIWKDFKHLMSSLVAFILRIKKTSDSQFSSKELNSPQYSDLGASGKGSDSLTNVKVIAPNDAGREKALKETEEDDFYTGLSDLFKETIDPLSFKEQTTEEQASLVEQNLFPAAIAINEFKIIEAGGNGDCMLLAFLEGLRLQHSALLINENGTTYTATAIREKGVAFIKEQIQELNAVLGENNASMETLIEKFEEQALALQINLTTEQTEEEKTETSQQLAVVNQNIKKAENYLTIQGYLNSDLAEFQYAKRKNPNETHQEQLLLLQMELTEKRVNQAKDDETAKQMHDDQLMSLELQFDEKLLNLKEYQRLVKELEDELEAHYKTSAEQLTSFETEYEKMANNLQDQLKTTSNQVEQDIDLSEEGYLERLKQPGFFCSTSHLNALSHLFKLPIHVHDKNSLEDEDIQEFNAANSTSAPIHLTRVGSIHYQLMIFPNR